MPKENELGTLIVVVLKARNLNDNHSFYKQDVFAQVTLNGATKRTHIDVRGGQHPVWDVELRFPVLKNAAEKHRKLEVACYCKEHKSEDILGNGSVDITETLKTGEFDEWIPLNIDGVVRGDIYLEMTFYINTPAPAPNLAVPVGNQVLTRRPSKLPPLDRLYRPPQNLVPGAGRPSNAMSKTHSGPGSSTSHLGGEPPLRPSSSSPPIKRSESPLPPLPEQMTLTLPLPQTLIPRGGKPHARPSDHQPPGIPSILRPRSEIISPAHAYAQMPPVAQKYEASIPVQSPHPDHSYYTQPNSPTFEYSTTVPRANYHAFTTNAIPAVPYRPLSTPPQTQTYGSNFSPSGPPSFPIPAITPLQQSGNYPALGSPPFLYRPPDGNDFPDPYLQVRYQTPLPLPPGTTYPHGNPTAPPMQSNHDNSLIDVPPLKKEEAMRHRTQEEEDRQLALQLDRELNLAG